MTYSSDQATQVADVWNLFNTTDEISGTDALTLINSAESESADPAQTHKRSILLLIAAIISGAIALAAGSN